MEDYPILLTIQQASRKIGKSEKTLRRWIQSGKLKADKHPVGGYLIKREDLEAVTKHVTKEWRSEQEIADLRMRVVMLESMVEELQGAVRAQQYDIEDLQIQVKKLQPKKPATRKRKTPNRRKRDRFE